MAQVPDELLKALVASIERLAIALGRDAERDEAFLQHVRDEAHARGVAEERRRQAVERAATHPTRGTGPVRGILGVFAEEFNAAARTVYGRGAIRTLIYLALGSGLGGGAFLGVEAAKEMAMKADPVVEVGHAP